MPPPRRPRGTVWPKTPLDGWTSAGRPRDAKDAQELRVPRGGTQVEELRARRVGGVARVDRAAREVPQQPAVDRAGAQLARSGAAVAVGNRIEQPADLAGGEQRIDRQAGPLFEKRAQPAIAQRLTERRRAPALPDDDRAERPAGRAVPDEHRLALVGDPDGVDPAVAGPAQALVDGLLDAAPERQSRPARPSPAAGTRSRPAVDARATTSPRSSKSRTFVLVVP